jgi:chromosomal replication initiation ATPase DnaA
MDLSVKEYKQRLAYKLVDKFTSEFYEKTGMKARVMVEQLNYPKKDKTLINDKIVSLDRLESEMLDAVPFTLDKNPLKVTSRKGEYVDVRCIFCYIACKMLGFSLISVGRYLNKDHTSIIHMNKRAQNLINTDERFLSLFKIIYEKLNITADADTI